MTRGGKRAGAGRKKSHNPTTTIRVPIVQKNQIKEWLKDGYISDQPAENQKIQSSLEKALSILKNSLTLKANAGGKIKNEIRNAIKILKK